MVFSLTLGVVDLAFWATRWRQRELRWDPCLTAGLMPGDKEGWEDKLQARMRKMAKEEFGVEIDDEVFLG